MSRSIRMQVGRAGSPPFSPPSGPASGSFNGPHPKSNFLTFIAPSNRRPIDGRWKSQPPMAGHPDRVARRKLSPGRTRQGGGGKGAVVVAIEPETPAYNSDLRSADVITAVDGVPLATAHDLQKEILRKIIGQTVELSVWRNGKAQKITITTGEFPSSLSKGSREKAPPKIGGHPVELYGLQLQDITPDLAGQFNLKSSTGVLVADVARGSPAAEADLQRGDLITEIDC